MESTEAARWHLLFLLLSLERAAPYLPEMRIPSVEFGDGEESLRKVAFDFVSAYRRVENSRDLNPQGRAVRYEALLHQTFATLEATIGTETSKLLRSYGEHEFQYATGLDAELFLWRRLLRRLAGVSGLEFPLLPPPLGGGKLEATRAAIIRHLGNPEELARRLKSTRDQTASHWDHRVLATYAEGADPLDWIENQIDFSNTRAAWRDIAMLLDQPERAALVVWAGRQAAAMGMHPESLADPGVDI